MTPKDLRERIFSRCVEEGDCLLWQGALGGNAKVPQMSINGKKLYVRRLLWKARHGSIPEGMGVSVSCGTFRCVHPSHLVVTSVTQRAQKAGDEGKFSSVARCAKIAANKRPLLSPLTPEQVADIKYGAGTAKEVGARNGVSKWTVWAIRRGDRWKDYSSPFAGLFTGLAANDGKKRAA